MGLKDATAKNFFGRKDVMTDLLGYVLHILKKNIPDGTISMDKLKLVSGEYYEIIQDADGRLKTNNRYRDMMFEYDTGQETVSVGLELQSRKDQDMVPRVMGYDARRYHALRKEGRMHRIINIVLDFDRKTRNVPWELNQMMPPDTGVTDDFFYNYGFVPLNIYDLTEKIELFHCEELK
ncbi:MAG: Rpn family recombination-promoting nuclease/putative transposase, partial [Victivallales bacterium]|nr:Rpn family recombination-promoting nuclease/putative transposase [Victivallales bacterium]